MLQQFVNFYFANLSRDVFDINLAADFFLSKKKHCSKQ